MPKAKSKNIHIATVIDAWFPQHHKKYGVFGGDQVHVRELTKTMERLYPVSFTLFYPAYPNKLYQLAWIAIAITRIIQYHRQKPFDCIHTHGYSASLAGKIASLICRIPIIQTVHGSSLMDLKSKTPKAWFERLILTNTKYTAQISISSNFKKYQNINKIIEIIPNGVHIKEFDQVQVEKFDKPTIIWVGRANYSKGLSVLRASILKLRKRIPNIQTKLISGGALQGKALIKMYKKSHVFVLPSLAESQPITLLEAWAAKLPVVVTDVGDNSTMVIDGINGYLVSPGNVQQLTNAILKTLRARTKNEKMGEAGYALVKEKYTWNQIAKRTWSVYKAVTKTK